MLCPGCSALDAHDTLKSLRREDYHCGLCACGYEPSVDEQVEVAFTVSPKIRRIAAHDPNTLPLWEYYKQILLEFGHRFDSDSFASLSEEVTLDALGAARRRKGGVVAALLPQFIIAFEPVTYLAHFIDVQASPPGNGSSLR